jgi:hypothetical protein
MMSRMLIAAIAASFLTSSPSHAADAEQGFTHMGVTYRYEVIDRDGGQIISGTSSDRATYRLFVKKGRVTGQVNGRSVSFRAADAQEADPVRVALR